MDRATSGHNMISSDRVQGTYVYGPGGEQVGTIDHLMIEKVSGRVAYAVMSRRLPWPRREPLSGAVVGPQVRHSAATSPASRKAS